MNILPLRLTDKLYIQLQTLSQAWGKPMAEIVRQSLTKTIPKYSRNFSQKIKYTNPLMDMAQKAKRLHHKLKINKYHFKELSSDELIYGSKR